MPSLLYFPREENYQAHFRDALVRRGIAAFHAIPVKFAYKSFGHAFYESSQRSGIKDQFSRSRAERIDWIIPALTGRDTDWHHGSSKKRKGYKNTRSVSAAYENFVVVLRYCISRGGIATSFIACYDADTNIKQDADITVLARQFLQKRFGEGWSLIC